MAMSVKDKRNIAKVISFGAGLSGLGITGSFGLAPGTSVFGALTLGTIFAAGSLLVGWWIHKNEL